MHRSEVAPHIGMGSLRFVASTRPLALVVAERAVFQSYSACMVLPYVSQW